LKSWSEQSGNFQLNHNTPVPYFNKSNLLDSILQGTSAQQRIGNKIFIKELEVALILNNKFDRTNVCYRFAVTASPSTTGTDAAVELFAGSGITGIHAPQNSILLHDATFPTNQGSSQSAGVQKERSHVHRVRIPINRAVVYNTSDGTCATRLVGWVTAYDAFGTLTTDVIASVPQTSYRILYTDQ
jgi:hypothetical protein